MTTARRMLGMLKRTWRSEQRREEQAEAEAATGMAAEEPDFGQAEAYEEQGSDLADEDIDKARVDDDSAVAEPESEPDSEHRGTKRKEGADDRSHVENYSFDEHGAEISWIKGGPGAQTGGWGSRQTGVPLPPGGECFAPCFETTRRETTMF